MFDMLKNTGKVVMMTMSLSTVYKLEILDPKMVPKPTDQR